jgi:hypothetical protein
MSEIQGPESMDLTWLKMLAVGAGCLGLGYILGRRFRLPLPSNAAINALPPYDGKSEIHEIEKIAEVMDDFKMVECPYLYSSVTSNALDLVQNMEFTGLLVSEYHEGTQILCKKIIL